MVDQQTIRDQVTGVLGDVVERAGVRPSDEVLVHDDDEVDFRWLNVDELGGESLSLFFTPAPSSSRREHLGVPTAAP